MTRRRIAFVDKDGCLYVSQEFNGDRNETLRFGAQTTIQCNWCDVYKEFASMCGNEYTLKNFRAIIRKIENMYGYNNVAVSKRVTTPKVDYLYIVTEEGYLELLECFTEPADQATVVFTVSAVKATNSAIEPYRIYCVCKTYKQLRKALVQAKQQKYLVKVDVYKIQ